MGVTRSGSISIKTGIRTPLVTSVKGDFDIGDRADPDPFEGNRSAFAQTLDRAFKEQTNPFFSLKNRPPPRMRSPATTRTTAPTTKAPMTLGFACLLILIQC